MHPINENSADIKETGPEDALIMSRMQKINSYSTGCKKCIPILEEQAKEEIKKMNKRDASRCMLRKRKENGSYYIEIWEPRFRGKLGFRQGL